MSRPEELIVELKGLSYSTCSSLRASSTQIRTRIRQHFRWLLVSAFLCVCAQETARRITGGHSSFSPNTHPELWFANDKWIANTIHELCSCHGDINQKVGPFSQLWTLCLWNWDAWRGLHSEAPEWAQGTAIARYWFCQSLRGLLWVQCNNHTPSGTQTDSQCPQKNSDGLGFKSPNGGALWSSTQPASYFSPFTTVCIITKFLKRSTWKGGQIK